MVKAVIFDLDGLLVDTEIISYRILEEILAGFGYRFTLEEYTRGFSGKPETANSAHLVEAYQLPWTPEEAVERNIRREEFLRAGLAPEEALERILRREEELHTQGVELKPGAKELLAYLQETGRGIAMASSSTRDRALNLLDQHGVTGYFQRFVFAGEVERGKPAPDVFLKACEKLGEAPEDCLVLEDSEAGIQAAHAARIPVICVPDLKTPERRFLDLTAAVCPSLDQVIPYLSDKKG